MASLWKNHLKGMDRHESRWTSGDWTVAGDEGHPNVRFLRSAHHGQQRFFTIFREKTTSRGRTMYKKLRKWWKHLVSIQHLKDWQMRWQKYVVLKCSHRPILKLLWGSKGDLFWVMSYPPLGRGPLLAECPSQSPSLQKKTTRCWILHIYRAGKQHTT